MVFRPKKANPAHMELILTVPGTPPSHMPIVISGGYSRNTYCEDEVELFGPGICSKSTTYRFNDHKFDPITYLHTYKDRLTKALLKKLENYIRVFELDTMEDIDNELRILGIKK